MIRLSLSEDEFTTLVADLAKLQAFRKRSIEIMAADTNRVQTGQADMANTQAILERLNEQLAMQRDDITVVVPNFLPVEDL